MSIIAKNLILGTVEKPKPSPPTVPSTRVDLFKPASSVAPVNRTFDTKVNTFAKLLEQAEQNSKPVVEQSVVEKVEKPKVVKVEVQPVETETPSEDIYYRVKDESLEKLYNKRSAYQVDMLSIDFN